MTEVVEEKPVGEKKAKRKEAEAKPKKAEPEAAAKEEEPAAKEEKPAETPVPAEEPKPKKRRWFGRKSDAEE